MRGEKPTQSLKDQPFTLTQAFKISRLMRKGPALPPKQTDMARYGPCCRWYSCARRYVTTTSCGAIGLLAVREDDEKDGGELGPVGAEIALPDMVAEGFMVEGRFVKGKRSRKAPRARGCTRERRRLKVRGR